MEHEIVSSLFALTCYLYMSPWSIRRFCCLRTSYYCMYLQFVQVSCWGVITVRASFIIESNYSLCTFHVGE